jgi:multidrug resistance efflux pump
MSTSTTPSVPRIDHPPVATTTDGLPLPAPPHRTLLMVVLTLLCGLALTNWLDDRSASRTLVGYLRAERTTIVAPVDSVIGEFRHQPGDVVTPGTVLVLLIDDELEQQVADRTAMLPTLEATLAQTRAQADVELALKLRDLEREEFEVRTLAAHHLEKQYYNEFMQTAWEQMLDRSDGLASIGGDDQIYRLASLPQMLTSDTVRMKALLRQQSARGAASISAAQAKLCRGRLDKIDALRSSLPEQFRTANGVDVATEQLAHARITLVGLEHRRRRLVLTAGTHGTVGLHLKQPGERVRRGDAIVELYDRERQHLDLPVPSRLIGRYPVGTLVRLRFSGTVRCRGRVSHVPPHTEQNVETPVGGDPLVRVTVEPIGRLWPDVPIGSSVEAEVE